MNPSCRVEPQLGLFVTGNESNSHQDCQFHASILTFKIVNLTLGLLWSSRSAIKFEVCICYYEKTMLNIFLRNAKLNMWYSFAFSLIRCIDSKYFNNWSRDHYLATRKGSKFDIWLWFTFWLNNDPELILLVFCKNK